MIVLPITLKAFDTLDSKPKVKKARSESVFHSRFSSDFFFHKGEGLKCANVNRWLTPKIGEVVPFFWGDSESKGRIPVDSQRRE